MSARPRVILTPGELLKAANRQRLTRAGLVRIMQENEARELEKSSTAEPSGEKH